MTKYNTSKPKDIEIYKIDVEAQEKLASKLDATAVPMLIFFKNGKEVARERGIRSTEEIKNSVTNYFQK